MVSDRAAVSAATQNHSEQGHTLTPWTRSETRWNLDTGLDLLAIIAQQKIIELEGEEVEHSTFVAVDDSADDQG